MQVGPVLLPVMAMMAAEWTYVPFVTMTWDRWQ